MAPGEPAWKSVGELASIGMTMVLATVIGLAGGYYADRWLGTSPIFLLVGLGLGIAAATAVLLVLDWAHPVALVFGLTILPCDLVAQGLRLARVQREG